MRTRILFVTLLCLAPRISESAIITLGVGGITPSAVVLVGGFGSEPSEVGSVTFNDLVWARTPTQSCCLPHFHVFSPTSLFTMFTSDSLSVLVSPLMGATFVSASFGAGAPFYIDAGGPATLYAPGSHTIDLAGFSTGFRLTWDGLGLNFGALDSPVALTSITVQTVPEPPLAILGLVTAASWWLRRHRVAFLRLRSRGR